MYKEENGGIGHIGMFSELCTAAPADIAIFPCLGISGGVVCVVDAQMPRRLGLAGRLGWLACKGDARARAKHRGAIG